MFTSEPLLHSRQACKLDSSLQSKLTKQTSEVYQLPEADDARTQEEAKPAPDLSWNHKILVVVYFCSFQMVGTNQDLLTKNGR